MSRPASNTPVDPRRWKWWLPLELPLPLGSPPASPEHELRPTTPIEPIVIPPERVDPDAVAPSQPAASAPQPREVTHPTPRLTSPRPTPRPPPRPTSPRTTTRPTARASVRAPPYPAPSSSHSAATKPSLPGSHRDRRCPPKQPARGSHGHRPRIPPVVKIYERPPRLLSPLRSPKRTVPSTVAVPPENDLRDFLQQCASEGYILD